MGAAAVASPLATLAAAPDRKANDAGAKIEKDVVIGKGGDADLHCDIYHPPSGTEKHMALVHLHGGGFAFGSKDILAAKLTPITARGYVSIAAQYRLSGAAKWPAQSDDVKTAIKWTRDNANRLGIDPNKIAVVGYSAGAYLALIAAGQSDTQLAACVSFYAPTELPPAMMKQLLLPPGADDATARAASPMTYVKAGFPPTLLFHGLSDVTVPPEVSIKLLADLRALNVPSELHTFAGVPHEFDMHPEFAEACAAQMDFFFDRYVLNPRTYPPFGPGGPPPGAPRGG